MHKVVFMSDKGTFKAMLNDSQVKKGERGQVILPDNFYSKGYFERMSDGNWDSLPELNFFVPLKFTPK